MIATIANSPLWAHLRTSVNPVLHECTLHTVATTFMLQCQHTASVNASNRALPLIYAAALL